MKYMLDTNICIYAIKHKPEQVLQRVKRNIPNGLCISSVTLAELEYGAFKSRASEKNRAAIMSLLFVLEVLPFDDRAAVEYGDIRAYLEKQGTPIGSLDMLIAGHARAEDLILVTNNMKEFERVPNLRLENWTEEKT